MRSVFQVLSIFLAACTASIASSPAAKSAPQQAKSADSCQCPAPKDPKAISCGIDVSHHSGDIDWQTVQNSGYQFVIIKSTEGETFVDPKFEENWRKAGDAGLRRSAYHFYVVEDDPIAQAELFVKTIGELAPCDMLPVLDVEAGTAENAGGAARLAENLKQFLEYVEAHYKVKPMINTNHSWWDTNVNADFSEYPLWIAEYEATKPTLPVGWKTWYFWQPCQNQPVPGLEDGKSVDINYFNDEEHAFLTMGKNADCSPQP